MRAASSITTRFSSASAAIERRKVCVGTSAAAMVATDSASVTALCKQLCLGRSAVRLAQAPRPALGIHKNVVAHAQALHKTAARLQRRTGERVHGRAIALPRRSAASQQFTEPATPHGLQCARRRPLQGSPCASRGSHMPGRCSLGSLRVFAAEARALQPSAVPRLRCGSGALEAAASRCAAQSLLSPRTLPGSPHSS